MSDFASADILDAVGVPLAPSQRVVYAVPGIHASGQLKPGIIVRVRRMIRGKYPERVDIRRDDGLSSPSAGPSASSFCPRSRSPAAGCGASSLRQADDE